MEVVADLRPDRPHRLEQKPRAVLERAAVLVPAVVDRRGEELREEVAVGGVELDAVEAGLPRPPGSRRERGRDLPQLRGSRPLGLEPVQRVGLARRAQALPVEVEPTDVSLPAAVGELQDVLAVVLVDALPELAPERDRPVVVDGRVVGDDEPALLDSAPRGDDRADAAARELELPVDARPGPRAVVVVEPPRDARAQSAVLDREVPELQRFEDRRGHGYGGGS